MRPGLWATLLLALHAGPAAAAAGDDEGLWSHVDPGLSLEAEHRHFPRPATHDAQHGDYSSVAAEASLAADWDRRDQAFTLTLFGRLDRHDHRRSHADVREAFYRYTARDFEWRIGVRKVFWGVTESAHLVDVINQTDFVENIDGEAKLGQPMINLAWFSDIGTFNFFLLPDFRERTFPAADGRPRPLLPVATEAARFPDGQGLDLAMRYFESFGAWDVGVSLFHGTSRDPDFDVAYDDCRVTARFQPVLGLPLPPVTLGCARARSASPPRLLEIEQIRIAVDDPAFVPVYPRIDQLGLDLQRVAGALALKLEALRRWADSGAYTAAAAGFEYTLYGLAGSDWSLGLLSEYLYDSRGRLARDIAEAAARLAASDQLAFDTAAAARTFDAGLRTQSAAAFQNDVFAGLRLSLNDLAGSEMLAGVIRDLDSGAVTASLEASRRVGSSNRVALNARLFSQIPVTDPQYGFRDDDYLELTLTHYF